MTPTEDASEVEFRGGVTSSEAAAEEAAMMPAKKSNAPVLRKDESAPTVPAGRQRGVCRFKTTKYGLISSDYGPDIFFELADARGEIPGLPAEIDEGDVVEYSVIEFKGELKASRVVKLESSATAALKTTPVALGGPKRLLTMPAASDIAVGGAPARRRARKPRPRLAPATPSKPDERFTGTCRWYTSKKKHGFIMPNAAGVADIFVHSMDLREGTIIAEGDRVEYGVGHYHGRVKAVDVVKLAGAPMGAARSSSSTRGSRKTAVGGHKVPSAVPPKVAAPEPKHDKGRKATPAQAAARSAEARRGLRP